MGNRKVVTRAGGWGNGELFNGYKVTALQREYFQRSAAQSNPVTFFMIKSLVLALTY